MSDRIQNLREFKLSRASIVIVPAILGVLSLGGVTARPLTRISAARDAHEQARELIDRTNEERMTFEALTSEYDLEQLDDLTARLYRLIPQELSKIRIYNVLRLAASAGDIRIGTIELGDEFDQQMVVGDETVVMREVRVSGSSTPAVLIAFVDEIRRCGLPTVVRDFSISRAKPQETRFDFFLGIGLLYYSPAQAASDEMEWE